MSNFLIACLFVLLGWRFLWEACKMSCKVVYLVSLFKCYIHA